MKEDLELITVKSKVKVVIAYSVKSVKELFCLVSKQAVTSLKHLKKRNSSPAWSLC